MAAYDPENIFAKIIKGDIPAFKIFETPHAIAILDAFPMAPGHSLLLPKHPCVSVTDMPADVAASVLSELPRLARAVQNATGAPGVNILTNSGKEAGQLVFHAHFHVIPRFANDELIKTKPSRGSMLTADEATPLLAKMSGSDAPFAATLAAIDMLEAEMIAGSISAPPPPPAASGVTGKGGGKKEEASPKKEGGKKGPPAGEDGKPVGPDGKPFKTEKKEKVKKKVEPAAAAAAPADDPDRPIDISWADIRVGLIVDAQPHPDSDKLYIETIDLGEEKPRQILSGLAHHMKLEEVKGAPVVCICNLKARKLAGYESNGMVLCASTEEKTVFVDPPAGTKPGDRITWAEYPGAPVEVKKMDKKKGWDAIMPDLLTDDQGNATYKGTAKWMVGGSVCTAKVAKAQIK